MVNRAALLLRWKEPGVWWINGTDPEGMVLTPELVNEERTVYLIPDEAAESTAHLRRWLRRNYQYLFEEELEGWYTDEALWPAPRTMELFGEWFEVECHSVLIDTVGGPIMDDEV